MDTDLLKAIFVGIFTIVLWLIGGYYIGSLIDFLPFVIAAIITFGLGFYAGSLKKRRYWASRSAKRKLRIIGLFLVLALILVFVFRGEIFEKIGLIPEGLTISGNLNFLKPYAAFIAFAIALVIDWGIFKAYSKIRIYNTARGFGAMVLGTFTAIIGLYLTLWGAVFTPMKILGYMVENTLSNKVLLHFGTFFGMGLGSDYSRRLFRF